MKLIKKQRRVLEKLTEAADEAFGLSPTEREELATYALQNGTDGDEGMFTDSVVNAWLGALMDRYEE